jgi:hypothetical protein
MEPPHSETGFIRVRIRNYYADGQDNAL